MSVDGAPSFTTQISQISESSHIALGLPISQLPSYPYNASCNTRTALLGIGLDTHEEGSNGGV